VRHALLAKRQPLRNCHLINAIELRCGSLLRGVVCSPQRQGR
jgi:hypothetical protein